MNKKLQKKILSVLFRFYLPTICIYLSLLTVVPLASAKENNPLNPTLLMQGIDKKMVTLDFENSQIIPILNSIQKQTNISFGFAKDVDPKSIGNFSIKVKNMPIKSALDKLFASTNYTYELGENGIKIVKAVKKTSSTQDGKRVTVKGRVLDSSKTPLAGAMVLVVNSQKGAITNENGDFVLDVLPTDRLEISYVGYKGQVVGVKKDLGNIVIVLEKDVLAVDDVVVVAFGKQRKESMVGSVSSINTKTLKSSNSDLTTKFAGNIAGVIGWQTGGIPGALTEAEMNTKFYIRGVTSFQTNANIDPLILIDNVESSKLDLSRLAPEDIENFSVMKDAAATAMYGARGANGVISVTTKKGQEGSVYTSVRYEVISTRPTKEIDVVDPITYMRMFNQAVMTRNPGAMPKYSIERIERTGSSKYPSFVYPANDWYNILFKDQAINHHMGVNVRGGSKIMQYYASVNYNYDQGMLKTDQLNQYNVNIKNNSVNYRINLNVNMSPTIRLVVNSTANLDKYHGPRQNVTQAYQLAFRASPTDFAPVYPADETYSWPHIRFGTSENGQKANPYAMIQSGYLDRSRFSATNRVEYIHDLSKLTKGLEVRASVALKKVGYYATPFFATPAAYYSGAEYYDFETGKHKLIQLVEGKRTLGVDNVQSSQTTQVSYEALALHTAAWDDHQTSMTGVFTAQETTTSDIASVLDAIPNRNMGLAMRGNYGFKDRYFVEGSFGLNGSERFAKDNQWGFFPALGCSWVASKESFLKTAKWISTLKFRYSWGKVGNDGVIKNPRYTHLPILGLGPVPGPLPGQNSGTSRPIIKSYPNEKIKWEIAEQHNLGIDATLFGGIFETTVDIYTAKRHNILDYRYTMPAAVGLEYLQLANVGKAKSQGIDISAKFQHAFSNNFWIILNGTFTYNKSTILELEEATDKPIWQRKVGKEISQSIGYIAEGLFKDQAEVDNSPTQGGEVMPGDIRYRDLDGNGIIDVRDATFIGYPETPRVIYGFNAMLNYKDLELGFSFQGSGKRSFFMDPAQINPFTGDRAMLTAIYNDHWTESNMKDRPFWPRLSDQSITMHNPQEDWGSSKEPRKSTYFMRSCTFLRCTSITLSYNLPKSVLSKIRMQNVKLHMSVNNPFMISNFDVWDVELGSSGFNYPIQRTMSAGISINF